MGKFGALDYDVPTAQDVFCSGARLGGERCSREGAFPDISFSLTRRRAITSPPSTHRTWRTLSPPSRLSVTHLASELRIHSYRRSSQNTLTTRRHIPTLNWHR